MLSIWTFDFDDALCSLLTYTGTSTIEMECVSGWICNALRRTSFKEDFYY
jgi:hypothetical protein